MAQFDKRSAHSYVKRLWVHGFVVGFALVGLFLAAWFFLSHSPAKEEEAKTAPAATREAAPSPEKPASQGSPPAAAAPESRALNVQLEEVLARLREATLKKDLTQFLGLYSATFPHLEDKRLRVARTWHHFDYQRLNFRLAEVSAQGRDQASALVTWEIESRNRKTAAVHQVTRAYRVSFTRESGQWHIAALEPLE